MIMRHASRMLMGTLGLAALGAAMAAWPARADSVDQNVSSAGTAASATPQPANPTAAEAPPAGNPVWAIPLSKLSETRDRPIFSPSRRPPPTIAAPIYTPASIPRIAKAEPERPPLTLVGTIAGENDAIAVFVVRGTGTVVRLHPKDSHEGWILRSVQGREATLEKGSESSVLALAPPGGAPEQLTAQAEPVRKPPRH